MAASSATSAAIRHEVEWACIQTLARARMMDCLQRDTKDTSKVSDWIFAQCGLQIWPEEKAKLLKAAHVIKMNKRGHWWGKR